MLNQRVARITDVKTSHLDSNFLFIYLNSHLFLKQVENFAHGAAQANVSTRDILSIELSPPLAEQQRIVAKLDAAFAEIERAIELVGVKEAEAKYFKDSLLANLLKDDAMV